MRILIGAAAVVLSLTFTSAQQSREAELLALLKSRVDAGKNVGTGRDWTLFALKDGTVQYDKAHRRVSVVTA